MTTKVTVVVTNGNAPVDVITESHTADGWVRSSFVQRVSNGGVHQEWVHGSQRIVIEEAEPETYGDNYQFKNPAPHSDMKVSA